MEQPEGEQKRDLDLFVSELLSKKGLTDDAKAHADLLAKVREKVYTAILASVPMRGLDMLEYYINEKNFDFEHLERVIKKADINMPATVDYALEEFKREYLEGK